jgi:hypothetical protein
MARKALYKHAAVVTVPDDGTSPVGSDEWNANPDAEGMLGFTPQTANSSTILTSANPSGTITPTDSVTVVAAHTGTTGIITRLVNTNTSQYDLLYLFADTNDNITLTNTSVPSTAGDVQTISGSNETLSKDKPTILMRKGDFWFGYGGGTASDLDTTNFAATAIVTASETIGSNDNDTTLPTSAAVKAYVDASPVGDITAVTAGNGISGGGTTGGVSVSIDTSITADLSTAQSLTNKTFVAPILGTPTSGVATNLTGTAASLTAGNATLAAGLSTALISTSGGTGLTSYTQGDILYYGSGTTLTKLPKGTTEQTLKMNTGATAPEWVTVAGAGATVLHKYSNSSQTTVFTVSGNSIAYDVGTTVATQAAGAGQREVYIRKIDANNEGVFTIIHKNGVLVEVQIA